MFRVHVPPDDEYVPSHVPCSFSVCTCTCLLMEHDLSFFRVFVSHVPARVPDETSAHRWSCVLMHSSCSKCGRSFQETSYLMYPSCIPHVPAKYEFMFRTSHSPSISFKVKFRVGSAELNPLRHVCIAIGSKD